MLHHFKKGFDRDRNNEWKRCFLGLLFRVLQCARPLNIPEGRVNNDQLLARNYLEQSDKHCLAVFTATVVDDKQCPVVDQGANLRKHQRVPFLREMWRALFMLAAMIA